jgi:hypothetical protein
LGPDLLASIVRPRDLAGRRAHKRHASESVASIGDVADRVLDAVDPASSLEAWQLDVGRTDQDSPHADHVAAVLVANLFERLLGHDRRDRDLDARRRNVADPRLVALRGDKRGEPRFGEEKRMIGHGEDLGL